MNLDDLTKSLNRSTAKDDLRQSLHERAKSFSDQVTNLHFSGGLYSSIAAKYLLPVGNVQLLHLRIRDCVWLETHSARAFAEQQGFRLEEIESENPEILDFENTSLRLFWHDYLNQHLMKKVGGRVTGIGIPTLMSTGDGNIFVQFPEDLCSAVAMDPQSCFFWDRAVLQSIFSHPWLLEFTFFASRFPVASSRYWNYILFHQLTGLNLHDYGFLGLENLVPASSKKYSFSVSYQDWLNFLK